MIINLGAEFQVLYGRDSPYAAVTDIATVSLDDGFRIGDGFSGHGIGDTGAGDFNGNGIEDFLVGQGYLNDWRVHLVYGTRSGFPADLLLNTPDGTNGFTLEGFTDSFGCRVHAAGDFNGDGYADIAFTAPEADFGIGTHGAGSGGGFVTQQGLVYVLFGHQADGIARVALAELDTSQGLVLLGGSFAGQLGAGLAGAGDTNGDGFDALVMSSRDTVLSSRDAIYGGAYVVLGHAANNRQILAGTSAGETLLGDDAVNAIVAGAGNDYLDGRAGADVLKGGAGGDTLVYDATDLRIEGDSGNDTLVIAGHGTALDVTLIDDLRIDGIEVIDLSGDGANSVHLALRDLLALADNRTLRISGEADDAMSTADGWSLADGRPVLVGDANYTLYSQAGASLLVEVSIRQSGMLVV